MSYSSALKSSALTSSTLKNCRLALFSLCCTVLIFGANFAQAQTYTSTHLRCFYRLDPSNLKTDTSWVWAIDAAIVEEARLDPNFNRKEFLQAFNEAHPVTPLRRASLQALQEWDPEKADFPKRPYINFSLHDPATTQQFDDTQLDKITGYWYSRPDILANVFYSETTQKDFVERCNSSLLFQGIQAPVAMYSAASDYFSYDYMIWTDDSANLSDKINKIVSFGDSVSDIQNMFNGTEWWLPTQDNYFIGRFSNGKNWLDYLSADLQLPVYDWAIGGAASQSVYDGLLRGVIYQVQSFLDYTTQHPNYAKNYHPENTLFTVLIGANDLISYGLTGDQIYANVVSALSNLIVNGGARNIMVVKLPDISKAPIFLLKSHKGDKNAVQAQVIKYNSNLNNLVTDIFNTPALRDTRVDAAEVNIHIYDAFTLVNKFIDNKEDYGITNATNPCLSLNKDSILNYTTKQKRSIGCKLAQNQADSYLFWDLLHPTTHTHLLLANYACHFIKKNFGELLNDGGIPPASCPPVINSDSSQS